jgi:hypothetical protein
LKSPGSRRRKDFEEEYCSWIRFVASDVARRLAADPSVQDRLLTRYKAFEDPAVVFRPLLDTGRLRRLVGDTEYIFLETDSVSVFPSLYSSDLLDFAVAMNRRYYYQGQWFKIISLNSEYVALSSDKMLAFALEHEFEMGRLFEAAEPRRFTPEEKGVITETAFRSAGRKLAITPEDLREDEQLMLRLSQTEALIPKPYAETAMLLWLEQNHHRLERFAVGSRSTEEEEMGIQLYEEFSSWIEFSHQTYLLFVREIQQRLRDDASGYA